MINLFYRSLTKVIKKLLKKFENLYKVFRFKIYDLRIKNSINYSKVPKLLFEKYKVEAAVSAYTEALCSQ